ncbi:MAG TPA: M1 family metallopeptidase [Candidatus Saccharimonadales bacterium]|nr:M1 family metallopeptidase [Candidatus Saccharimonadales bacterium]
MSQRVTRLYEQFQPENYNLHLVPDREAMTFVGSVTIAGKKVGRPSNRLTFHQKGMKITEVKVVKRDKQGDVVLEVERVNNQNSFDEVRIHTKEKVFPGQYSVTLTFEGKITKPMHGIYPCYFKHDGKEKMLIATQFESHHAREAFPCIDEPEAKATFDLSLTIPAGETVLANTPIKSEEQAEKLTKTVFETTPRMSTYLLAFVYGEMHGVEAKTKYGTLVRSWATVAQPKQHLKFANDEAVSYLEFFADYFQTPFPLPKLDQVALPDFDSLAMENWGLVTYREIGLLADPDNRSLSGEQLISIVVAHELSHQWFGNLVTMRWWDDLWLNESFASIMENLAPDRLHPDWEQWEEFVSRRVLSAAQRDIYKDVQPVGVHVRYPDEISTLFDPAIVYAKGARLLKMLYDYIGEEAFRNGLQEYFKKHAYGNTERDDLWDALSASSHHDIKKLMTPWLQQPGTPLVRVKRDGQKLELSQQRFLMDGEDKESLWPIPLLASIPVTPDVFEGQEAAVTFEGAAAPQLNVHGNSHFITAYQNPEDVKALDAKLADHSIDSLSRLSLLTDKLLLARAGQYALTDILELIRACDQEPREAVWSIFSLAVSQAQLLTDGDKPTDARLRDFQAQLARYWYEKLGWEDQAEDDPNTKHLRTIVLSLSLGGEYQPAVERALEMFGKAGSVADLPAEQRLMIARTAVRLGKPEVIDQLMTEYAATHNPDVQQAITVALCSSRDTDVIKKVIDWGMRPDGAIRQQDIDQWFAYMMRNYYSRDLAWQWLGESWKYLTGLFGGGKHMEYFIWYGSGPLSTPEWEKSFHDFFTPLLDEPGLQRNIQIAFGEIATRVAWRQREEASLKKYFASLKN